MVSSIPLFSHAQDALIPYTTEDASTRVNIYIDPDTPKPNEPFVVSLEAFSVPIDTSIISFYENGVLIQKEQGVTQALYKNNASKTIIRVIIETPEGRVMEKTKTIVPGSASITWQAMTNTPPFYKGKALYVDESILHLYAVGDIRDQNGNTLNPKSLVYTWDINGTVKGDQSGFGKNSLVLNDKFVRISINVKVTIKSIDGVSIATDRISIPIQKPQVLLYKIDPLYGIEWGNTLTNISLSLPELSVLAFPFNFSSVLSNMQYQWSINNRETDVTSDTIVLRSDSNQNAETVVRAQVRNTNALLQSSSSSFTLNKHE